MPDKLAIRFSPPENVGQAARLSGVFNGSERGQASRLSYIFGKFCTQLLIASRNSTRLKIVDGKNVTKTKKPQARCLTCGLNAVRILRLVLLLWGNGHITALPHTTSLLLDIQQHFLIAGFLNQSGEFRYVIYRLAID